MAMNDEETVALIVGGHTFGKSHGAGDPDRTSAPSPRARPSSSRASAGRTRYGTGKGDDTLTSGLEGAWTNEPTRWDNGFLDNLFGYDWELTTSPAGRAAVDADEPRGPGHRARRPRSVEAARPDDADDRPGAEAGPDLRADRPALPREPGRARRRVRQGVVQAAAPRHGARRALPRPAGSPPSRSSGRTRSPRSTTTWSATRTSRRSRPRSSSRGCRSPSSCRTAWASAASFRGTDKRGGANGARIRLLPQKDWEVNDPAELAKVLQTLEGIQQDFNGSQSGGKKVSLADLIVLGGCAAVEKAAKDAGHDVTVPFAPGRTDASQEQTDVDSFAVLEPTADGFRNYLRAGDKLPPEQLPRRAGVLPHADRPRDDGPRRRPAGAQRQRRAVRPRRAHRPAGLADQRLLREPARHGHGVDAVRLGRERVRGSRSRHRRGPLDRHRRRPRLRVELAAPGARRGLRAATTPRRSSCTTSWRRGTR